MKKSEDKHKMNMLFCMFADIPSIYDIVHYPIKPRIRYKYEFVIPKGAKLYIFRENGEYEAFTKFDNTNELPEYVAFHTIAISAKSAENKFNKFKNQNEKI